MEETIMNRYLILEDGTIYLGKGFGHDADCIGELVFTTGMTGYQESITDQSYNGQIITFTYPLIGNTGINRDDNESISPTCKAIVVKEYARKASNFRNVQDLNSFLIEKKIVGIAGIDTRALVRKLREIGTIKACIVDSHCDIEDTLLKLRNTSLPLNNVEQVSTKTAYPNPGIGRRVVVIDFGLKHSILRELSLRNCDSIVMPHTSTSEEVLALYPDGVMLTNGPGDPKSVPHAIQMIRELMGKVPVFGICLGHQLLALANDADTFKLRYGHRGFNHPVLEVVTGKINFTSQNHGYTVDPNSIDRTKLYITHTEINDQTVEGIRHRQFPAFSVQFHPDATPGPHDGVHIFDEFMEMMDTFKEKKNA
jgi:carbamoyl-phosphate synthase small subunit